jgi:hypothetical protein
MTGSAFVFMWHRKRGESAGPVTKQLVLISLSLFHMKMEADTASEML